MFLLGFGLKGTEFTIAGIVILACIGVYALKYFKNFSFFILNHTTPKQSFTSLSKTVLRTFKDLDVIQDGTRMNVEENDAGDICISIKNATLHEQNTFNTAIKELLSPIDNPRYVIVKNSIFKNKYEYNFSFACPSAFANNSSNVEVFKRNLQHSMGSIDVKYVYSEEGRKLLVKCRKNSFITKNDKHINKRQRVTNFD